VSIPPQFVRRIKQRLLQQKRSLERSTLSAVEQGRETIAEDAQDTADQAVFSYQKELLFTRGTHDHGQLSLVKHALERLDEGSFGECVNCGNQIGPKRLEAAVDPLLHRLPGKDRARRDGQHGKGGLKLARPLRDGQAARTLARRRSAAAPTRCRSRAPSR